MQQERRKNKIHSFDYTAAYSKAVFGIRRQGCTHMNTTYTWEPAKLCKKRLDVKTFSARSYLIYCIRFSKKGFPQSAHFFLFSFCRLFLGSQIVNVRNSRLNSNALRYRSRIHISRISKSLPAKVGGSVKGVFFWLNVPTTQHSVYRGTV